MKDFHQLGVWVKSHTLTLRIYDITRTFPREELFGLTSQLRRSVSSIPANIAEGCGKRSDPDFARHLQIGFGSACEVEYHLILARDLNYLNADQFVATTESLIEIKKMLSSLISRVRASNRR